MDHELTVLPSGVTVVSESMRSVRSVALGAWITTGSRDEGLHEAGCAHFLEHLLFKGTGKRSARDIAETLDAVGGEMNAFTSKEMTCFYARVLGSDLPLAFDVLADMLVDARNTEADVEAERQVVLSEIDIHLDTPDDLVHSDISELVLGDHPLALETLGTVRSITGLGRDTIHDHFLREVVDRGDGTLWDVVTETWPGRGPAYVFEPDAYFAQPPYSQDYQGIGWPTSCGDFADPDDCPADLR